MDDKKILKVLSQLKSNLEDSGEKYLDSIARDALGAITELKELNKDEEFDFTIRDVIDDISYQTEREFDIYKERKDNDRKKYYEQERNKLIKSIERIYWKLLHEIQGREKTN